MTRTMLPVTVWMNMPSFHQATLLRALGALDGIDLRVHFARPLSAERAVMGWRADLVDLPADYLHGSVARALVIAHAERRRIHIFGGMWAEWAFAAALTYLRVRHSTCAIYAEARDPHVLRSRLKLAAEHRFARWIARDAALLPVAGLGARFYEPNGFAPVYPFGYFQQPAREPELTRSGARAVFVGQLIDRKGVDVLIEALSPLFGEFSDLTLTVIGDGERHAALAAQAGAHPIEFVGVLPSPQIPARLAEMDVLILPSRFDGWGMVVNEALMVGTPVIVSDQCGAADLIRNGHNGWIFPNGDVTRLRDRLRAFLKLSEAEKLRMRRAAAASRDAISAGAAAQYLASCLRHLTGEQSTQPTPPWRYLSHHAQDA